MPYMAQQAVRTAIRDAFRERDDTLAAADEAARVRAWLSGLPIDRRLVAAIVEPVEAIEDGLRDAARARASRPGVPTGDHRDRPEQAVSGG